MDQSDQSDDKLISNGNKMQSESQLKNPLQSPIHHKQQTQSENTINYITDQMNDVTINNKRNQQQSNEHLTNNFLNADRGLWSSKDSVGNSDGGAARKLR